MEPEAWLRYVLGHIQDWPVKPAARSAAVERRLYLSLTVTTDRM
ncbi:hypothetical protein [Pantoea stewartii]|nr:hypothetical protein [Pantoea stewartii]